MDHQTNRFEELDYILEKNSNVNVIIAGNDSTKNHALGTGLAVNQWVHYSKLDINKVKRKINNIDVTMNQHINILITNLQTKYGDRVKLGAIGFSNLKTFGLENFCNTDVNNDPSKNKIHVWGANETNWNLDNNQSIEGDGQVDCLKQQKPGVFGIVTTYWKNGHDKLFTDTTEKLKGYLS